MKEKDISFIFAKEAEHTKQYDCALIRNIESNLIIDLANRTETSDEVTYAVKQSFEIPADEMKNFCFNLIDALVKYEEKYKNGKGISIASQ